MSTAPLADLHRHLDGSLREATLRDLAAERGLTVASNFRFHPHMGLDEALSRFALTVACLQSPSALRRVAAEICDDAAAEGVTTLEIRFAPQLHLGSSVEVNVDAVLEGVRDRAGIILCGLYGEPPGALEKLVWIAASRRGVVGIDLAGSPAPSHGFGLRDYVAAFSRAGELGLGRTVHAGEGRPPDEIRFAIAELGADRIGHATSLLDDPGLVDLVRERRTTLEACITSNYHTGAIAGREAHPLSKWLALGLRACVNTDNTLLSNVTARSELDVAARLPGMTAAGIDMVISNGHKAAFRRTR